jgi:uncharacterized protein YggE
LKAVLATLCTLVCASLASANITVTGTGKVVYVPDLGVIGAGVQSDGKTAAEAWQANAAVVKKLFAALKRLGIDPRDVQTTGLGVSPRYVRPEGEEPRLVGYSASYNLSVKVRQLDRLGRILDVLVENGANRNVSISFACADPEKLLDTARARASAEARKKAELYARGAGAALGQVLTITEGAVSPWRHYRFEYLAKGAAASLPIATGEQELSVSVTATYQIVHHAGPAPFCGTPVPAR